jgi:NADPH-dependent glutamate synthase beta subunit-like oxidoreductase
MEPIRVTRGGVYVPKLYNDGRSEDEKIKGHYRFLSFAEQQDLFSVSDAEKPFAFEGRVVAAMLHKIENLEVEDDKGKRVITTGAQLVADPALSDLAMEFWTALRNLSAVDKKKLPSQLSSGGKGTQKQKSTAK